MNYMTTAETAKKWGITTGRITTLAQGGRIPGAERVGHQWMIPGNAEKPADARTRAGKVEKSAEPDTFRFPGFEYRSLSSFDPPLNEEELVIRAATEAYYACRFKEADRLLGNLADRTENRYLRTNALYTGCMIDIDLCRPAHFLEQYDKLTAELEEDFPHKAEMMEYLYSLKATLGDDTYYSRVFHVQPDYEYHKSFLPRLANLCAVSLTFAGENLSVSELRAHELSCIFLKDSEAYADLVPLHLYLGYAYSQLGDSKKQKYHFKEALTLAEEHEIYYCVMYHYYYMRKLLKPVMMEFSEEFQKKIEILSESTHRKYVRFLEAMSMNSIYKLLPHNGYIFLHYALQGLSNKEIADRLHISVGAVGKQFGEIYELLGVNSKTALVALYQQSF